MYSTLTEESLLHSSYVKSQIVTSNRTNNFFYHERAALYVYQKIPEFLNGVISQSSSEWFLLKVPQRTKTCSKTTTKKLELPQLMLFECLYSSSSLSRSLFLIKLQTFLQKARRKGLCRFTTGLKTDIFYKKQV